MSLFVLFSCSNEEEFRMLESVSIINKIDKIVIGEPYTLNVSLNPAEIDEIIDVKWKSSDQSIIYINEYYIGLEPLIIANKKGDVKITLTVSVERGGRTVDFSNEVTIQVIPVELEAIRLNRESIEIVRGGDYRLEFFPNPETSEIGDVEWSSSDDNIASVDNNGIVRGITIGDAVITVRDKSTNISASVAFFLCPKVCVFN